MLLKILYGIKSALVLILLEFNLKFILTAPTRPLVSTMFPRFCFACIMTQMHLANHLKEIPSDMNIFPIYSNGVHLPHQLAIAYSKGRYLPLYMKYLIELLLEYASTVETVHLAHKADPLV